MIYEGQNFYLRTTIDSLLGLLLREKNNIVKQILNILYILCKKHKFLDKTSKCKRKCIIAGNYLDKRNTFAAWYMTTSYSFAWLWCQTIKPGE